MNPMSNTGLFKGEILGKQISKPTAQNRGIPKS